MLNAWAPGRRQIGVVGSGKGLQRSRASVDLEEFVGCQSLGAGVNK